MITGIAHNAVTVRDMKESLCFYTEALGFKKAFEIANPETGAPWIVYLAIAPGQFLELFYDGTEENPWRDSLIGFNHFCFEVNAFAAQATRLILNPSRGQTRTGRPGSLIRTVSASS